MKKWLSIAFVIIVLDQITKYFATANLVYHEPNPALSFLNFTLMHNPGAAFSFLSEAGGWQRWFFTVIAFSASVFLIFWIKTLTPQERLTGWGLTFILGGAIGNLIDRLFFGYVIDFIQVYYHAQSCFIGFSPYQTIAGQICVWPTFNIADSAISVGAVILILDSLLSHRKTK